MKAGKMATDWTELFFQFSSFCYHRHIDGGHDEWPLPCTQDLFKFTTEIQTFITGITISELDFLQTSATMETSL